MDAPVALTQHLRGAASNPQVTWLDENGEPAAASGAVTVRVQQADGTDVVAAGGSTTGTNPYVRALTVAQAVNVALLTATWTAAGDSSTRMTWHEIVGGFYFSVADVRAFDPTLNDATKYPSAIVRQIRREVEDECELITGCTWVPRYRRFALDGTGSGELVLPDPFIRSIRSVRIYTTATVYTAFTATEVAELLVYQDGRLRRPGNKIFEDGSQNVVIEYECGRNGLPADLLHATKTRIRSRLNMEKSGIPDRATSFTLGNTGGAGGVFSLATPGRDGWETGIPEVDAVYQRHNQRATTIVSRNFDFDPSRWSLFHGGRR